MAHAPGNRDIHRLAHLQRGGEHLLGIRGMDADAIHHFLDMSEGFKEISRRRIKKVPTLRGRTVLNAFFEASTRTRVSFELAAKRLSADGVNISASGSSLASAEPTTASAGGGRAVEPGNMLRLRGSEQHIFKKFKNEVSRNNFQGKNNTKQPLVPRCF